MREHPNAPVELTELTDEDLHQVSGGTTAGTEQQVFEIQQDVTVNKARTQDKMYNKWDEYIRG
jgi:hypothetical protein